MKKNRRDFIKLSTAGTAALSCLGIKAATAKPKGTKPIVISTWNHGIAANAAAWALLEKGKPALDAAEVGVKVVESDPEVRTVGLGGYPDRDGFVTLDACIMDYQSNCGAVAFLQNIENPVSVARKVMEETPHVMLVGEGALRFALDQGFTKTDLLTTASKNDWENWKKEAQYSPEINIENHDTIGMLALDQQGNLAGACTTSGAAWKMHGRVGDSPIIGAGLFLDNDVGAACATGLGEAVIRVAGSATVVELMRQGLTPQKACEKAVSRIYKKLKDVKNLQVGFLALDKDGNYGAFAIHKGFNFATCTKNQGNKMADAQSIFQ